MSIKDSMKNLSGRKIALLGLGAENFSLLKMIVKKKIDCFVTVCDARERAELEDKIRTFKSVNISWKLGAAGREHFDGFDILFRSPGWPLFDPEIIKARKLGVTVTSPMRLFFALCPSARIIGVTGTKGKGTTASLVFHFLKKAGARAWLGGNIGIPPFDFFDKIRKTDWVILELSSFQLEDMDQSPRLAVVTNFFPEHLAPADPLNPNYHPSTREYWQAKFNILKWQKNGDAAVINPRLKAAIKRRRLKSRVIYFSPLDWTTKLIGAHNQENLGAAAAVAAVAGLKEATVKKAAASFKGLEHRLEFVDKFKRAAYYNDSFATTPEAAITALRSFAGPTILLAGGAEKNSDFRELAVDIKKRTKLVILFKGEATPRLKKELARAGYPAGKIKTARSMAQAVRLSRRHARPGDTVLLSPACASFGMFKNYKERGLLFKKAVKRFARI